jgi:hypothetical protein
MMDGVFFYRVGKGPVPPDFLNSSIVARDLLNYFRLLVRLQR